MTFQDLRLLTDENISPKVVAGIEDEARDAIIGMDERWNLLFVVHLEIEGERFRIISARRATPRERQVYES